MISPAKLKANSAIRIIGGNLIMGQFSEISENTFLFCAMVITLFLCNLYLPCQATGCFRLAFGMNQPDLDEQSVSLLIHLKVSARFPKI
jgi:hypothetical protein